MNKKYTVKKLFSAIIFYKFLLTNISFCCIIFFTVQLIIFAPLAQLVEQLTLNQWV